MHPIVKLAVTKLHGVNVTLDLAFDPDSVVAALEKIGAGQNPIAAFAEFICHLSVRGLRYETDEPVQKLPRPSSIALPNGFDPRALRAGT